MQVVIVTGGAKMIGKAAGRKFAEEGDTVILCDVSLDLAEKTAAEIRGAYGNTCEAYYMDISDREQVFRVMAEIYDRYGSIDVLVNNAGISGAGRGNGLPTQEQCYEDVKKLMDVNFFGTLNCIQAAIPYMQGRNYGRIVNVTSLASQRATKLSALGYSASKSAINALTRHCALWLGGDNICVNGVAPGWIDSDMGAGLGVTGPKEIQQVPLGRLGSIEDVAEAIAFLASEAARYISGTVLDVNGGLYMRP